MNCRRAQHRLSEYLDGELLARERAAIAAHLEACPDCRAEAAALGRAGRALEALGVGERAPDLTSDLQRRLSAPPARRLARAWVGAAVVAGAVGVACLAWVALQPPAAQPAASRTEIASRPDIASPPAGAPPLTAEAAQAEPTDQAQQRTVQMAGGPGKARPPRGVSREQPEQEERRTPTPVEEARPVSAGAEAPPVEQEAPTPIESPPVEARSPQLGVILLLGEPQPLPPSSQCYLEVSFPDGAKSVSNQSVERNAAGEPRAVHVSYEQFAAQTDPRTQGG